MRKQVVAIIILSALIGAGCSRQSSSGDVAADAPQQTVRYTNPTRTGTDTGTGTGSGTGTGGTTPQPPTPNPNGNSVRLSTNAAAMTAFTGTQVGSMSDVVLTISLSNFGQPNYTGRFQGSISLSYSVNNGRVVTPTFNTGSASGDIQFNYWWTNSQGRSIFQTFAEEAPYYSFYNWPYSYTYSGLVGIDPGGGGLILVIDSVQDFGDGGTATVGGKVYFRNFRTAAYPKPDMKCWLLPNNPPYDCKGFLSGSNINPTIGGEPGNGYQLLGTFTGLNARQALGFQ